MRTIALIAFAATTTACSFGGEAPSPKVEETVSGLTPGAGKFVRPDILDMEATQIEYGFYDAVVVDVMAHAEGRTDLVEGAELSLLVEDDVNGQGYLFNNHLRVQGMDGRLRGSSFLEREDPEFHCAVITETTARGRALDTYRFELVIEQDVYCLLYTSDAADE